MGEDFSRYRIKDYEHWSLFMHTLQVSHIGRCYAWAKDPYAETIEQQSKAMRDELFDVVIPNWKLAVNRLWLPDAANHHQDGNEYRHLHWHFIPRYNRKRTFAGLEFTDPNPKGNYSPYDRTRLPEHVLVQIQRELTENL